jgi:hypothetical protein
MINPATKKQIPDQAILDAFNKQAYLGNQFAFALNQEVLTTSETPLVLLNNSNVSPFPSSQTIFWNFSKLVCLTASQNAVIRMYLNPTVTSAGTANTPVNVRPASATTSISTLTTAPTIASNGTLIGVLSSLPGAPDISQLMTILDPSQSALLTVQTSSATTYIAAAMSWYEL